LLLDKHKGGMKGKARAVEAKPRFLSLPLSPSIRKEFTRYKRHISVSQYFIYKNSDYDCVLNVEAIVT